MLDNKKIAKECLLGFKYIGTEKVKWEIDDWTTDYDKTNYLLTLYEPKKELSKKEEKIVGFNNSIITLDGTEGERIAILFEILEQIVEIEDKVLYNIDDIIKVVDKWKKR